MEDKKKRCCLCGVNSGYLAKCYECGKVYCYDHINGSGIKRGMHISARIKDVCDECLKGGEWMLLANSPVYDACERCKRVSIPGPCKCGQKRTSGVE